MGSRALLTDLISLSGASFILRASFQSGTAANNETGNKRGPDERSSSSSSSSSTRLDGNFSTVPLTYIIIKEKRRRRVSVSNIVAEGGLLLLLCRTRSSAFYLVLAGFIPLGGRLYDETRQHFAPLVIIKIIK